MGLSIKFIAIVVTVLAVVVGRGDAATYVVGDGMGWTIPTGGATAYINWASRHTFAAGDILVFNFATGAHDVARVTRQGFDGCSSNNPISLVTQGPANITLDSTSPSYFICTFGQHCSLGQRLAINVSGASAPTPAPTPPPTVTPRSAPAPAPTPSRGSTPSPTPTPTPSGGSTPAPAPTPSGGTSPSPSPSPSSNPTPSQEPTPSPGPSGGGGASPPSPPPPPGSSPGSPPPGENGNPPPAPSSAPTMAIATSFVVVVFASIAMGLAI